MTGLDQGQHVEQMLTYTALGTPDTVKAYLDEFRGHADADELILAHQAYTLEARLRSVELVATIRALIRARQAGEATVRYYEALLAHGEALNLFFGQQSGANRAAVQAVFPAIASTLADAKVAYAALARAAGVPVQQFANPSSCS